MEAAALRYQLGLRATVKALSVGPFGDLLQLESL